MTQARSHLNARELLGVVLDKDSFESWDSPIELPVGLTTAYRDELRAARERTGLDESVITGSGSISGIQVAVIVSEFGFMGGSVGVDCARRIHAAVVRASAEGLPLLAAPASGGTRMQEGTVAFVHMIHITSALVAHRVGGLPYLVYLRHPTTGGVFASWGLLGHITVAEPGALLGFLGPKVYAAMSGSPFPEGIQTSENLARHGLIDAVVPPTQLAELTARALGVLRGGGTPRSDREPAEIELAESTWESVKRTRDQRRPGIRDLLKRTASDIVPLLGTAEGEQQGGLLLALAKVRGMACIVIGQDRLGQRRYGPIGPAGLRQARRGIRLAAELRLPIVTVIDTPGASLSKDAEEGGLASEIARCLVDLLIVPSPTVAVLLGEGGGGAAMALLPADRIVAASNAWLSPLPPEGASSIVHHGDPSFAAEIAEAQGIGARQLLRDGIVDTVVDEGDHDFLLRVGDAIAYAISAASATPLEDRSAWRSARFDVGRLADAKMRW